MARMPITASLVNNIKHCNALSAMEGAIFLQKFQKAY